LNHRYLHIFEFYLQKIKTPENTIAQKSTQYPIISNADSFLLAFIV
jgi:hypothetical protein